ncbi:hypothetical protein DFH09DRAFT_1340129 [Mycena vulgaris]|nr:hypothetical protein DFH09DRAFT_1340129 [Mycena vulgaris]
MTKTDLAFPPLLNNIGSSTQLHGAIDFKAASLSPPRPAPPSSRPRSLANDDLKPNAHPYPPPAQLAADLGSAVSTETGESAAGRGVGRAFIHCRRWRRWVSLFPARSGSCVSFRLLVFFPRVSPSYLPLPALHPTFLHFHPIRHRQSSTSWYSPYSSVSPPLAPPSLISLTYTHSYSPLPSSPRFSFHLLTAPRLHISHRPSLPSRPHYFHRHSFYPTPVLPICVRVRVPPAQNHIAHILLACTHPSIHVHPSLPPSLLSLPHPDPRRSRASPLAPILPILISFSLHLTHPHLSISPALPVDSIPSLALSIPLVLTRPTLQRKRVRVYVFSEILALITGLEYAFVNALKNMRSLARDVRLPLLNALSSALAEAFVCASRHLLFIRSIWPRYTLASLSLARARPSLRLPPLLCGSSIPSPSHIRLPSISALHTPHSSRYRYLKKSGTGGGERSPAVVRIGQEQPLESVKRWTRPEYGIVLDVKNSEFGKIAK